MTSRRRAVAHLALFAGGVPFVLGSKLDPGAVAVPVRSSARVAQPGAGSLQIVDVVSAGAAGDGRADDSGPVEQAIRQVADRDLPGGDNGAGVVYFPAGTYALSRPLQVPRNVVLVGESAMASRIVYSGGDTDAFVTFGRAGQIAVYSGIRALSVNAGKRAATTVRLYGPQEGSTVSDAVVVGAKRIGIEVVSEGITGGSNKFTVERSWVWTDGDEGLAGIAVRPGGGPLAIRDTTFVGTNRAGDPPEDSAGVVAEQSIVALDDVNVEHFESHTYLDRTQADIRNVTGFFNSYGVKTSAASTNTSVYLTNAGFDQAKASVLDQGTDVRIGFCRSYCSEAYKHDQRQFRRNFWDVGTTNVWGSDQAQATLGYGGPAGGDASSFGVSTLHGGQWRRVADVDAQGVFGAADSGFDGAHLRLGEYHLWVDASGSLRMKRGAPGSDGDGAVVGG